MATFEYSVDGQSITTTKAGRLVSGTIGVNTVKFTFDSSWDGLEKWATFDPNPGKPYKQPLDANGECMIPGEVMGGITLRIGAFGLADGQAYPTVWANKLQMEEGCFIDVPVSDWPEPSPVIEEILEELENKVDKPEDATPGNVAVIGSNNNIADSGVSKDNLILAPQLASNNIKIDSIPYLYRQTGGGIGVGNREYDSIVGGSVVYNQVFERPSNGTYNQVTIANVDGQTIVLSGTASGTIYRPSLNAYKTIIGHVYFAEMYKSDESTENTYFYNDSGGVRTSLLGFIGKATASKAFYLRINSGDNFGDGMTMRGMIVDLTVAFESAVAEQLYTLYQSDPTTARAFVHQFFKNDVSHAFNTGTLESVSGLSSHQMKDGNGNVIAEYPLDSSLTLRGVAVIDDYNNIKFDGDEYAPDGMVTRKYGIRAYQSGDESLANAITDMTNTVYKLTTPTTETAEPYESLQICDPLGTEEYVTTGICPVGHVTQYPENQVAKLDGLPSDFSTLIAPTEKEFKASATRTAGFKFIYQNQLYKCIANVASGAAYTIGTNVKKTTIAEELDLLS